MGFLYDNVTYGPERPTLGLTEDGERPFFARRASARNSPNGRSARMP